MSRAALEIGAVIAGRYEVESAIASGGFATVFVARHLTLRCPVALKVLKPGLNDNPKVRKRFLREARVVTALRHPNIVVHHDLGEEPDGLLYLAMEYLDGRSLSEVARAAPLDPGRALRVLSQIASALEMAHANGVLHRDLKPANVMIVQFGGDPDHVKLIDFGILKHFEPERRVDDGLTTTLTEVRGIIGTPQYMAPEQIRGRPLDARADQYALAVVAYELLVGRRPFQGASKVETLTAQLRDPMPRVTTLACGLAAPDGLDAVLRRALAKEPSERFESCTALVEALGEACAAVTDATIEPPSLPSSLGLVPLEEVTESELDARSVGRTAGATTPIARPRMTAAPRARATPTLAVTPRAGRRLALVLAGALVPLAAAAGLWVLRAEGTTPPVAASAVVGSALGAPRLVPVRPAPLLRPPLAVAHGDRRGIDETLPVRKAAPAPPVAAPAPSTARAAKEEPAAPDATISIAVRPVGRITLDGRYLGDGMVNALPVRSGKRHVRATNAALGLEHGGTVSIRPGQHRRILIDLNEGALQIRD